MIEAAMNGNNSLFSKKTTILFNYSIADGNLPNCSYVTFNAAAIPGLLGDGQNCFATATISLTMTINNIAKTVIGGTITALLDVGKNQNSQPVVSGHGVGYLTDSENFYPQYFIPYSLSTTDNYEELRLVLPKKINNPSEYEISLMMQARERTRDDEFFANNTHVLVHLTLHS